MPMYRVRVHSGLLRDHLAEEDGETVTDSQVRRHLIEAGFAPQADLWLVYERDLGFLQPSEVAWIEPVREEAPLRI